MFKVTESQLADLIYAVNEKKIHETHTLINVKI